MLENEIIFYVYSNLQDGQSISPRSKLAKDKDRRKSIIQAVSDFFTKKSPTKGVVAKDTKDAPSSASSLNKLKFKIALMGKERSKVFFNLSCLYASLARVAT